MHTKSRDWTSVWMRFKEGDLNAFQEIYDGFLPNLHAYGAKLAPGFELLDDCIQELFLELYGRKHPNLRDFASDPGCALMKIDVEKYTCVFRFQNVLELYWQGQELTA